MKKYFPFVLILSGLVSFNFLEVWGTSIWKYYGTNDNGSYYYDEESLARPSRERIRVWVQSAYTDQGITHWAREGGGEFQSLSYTLIWVELNCVEKAIRLVNILFPLS